MSKRALTAPAVARIRPPAFGQEDVFDRGYPGLALRLSYGGTRAWTYHYRIGGRLRRMTLGTFPKMTLAEARDVWRLARESVAKGIDPVKARSTTEPLWASLR